MKSFRRLLKYVATYKLSLGLGALFNILMVIFSVVSFAGIVPFLQILFGLNKAPDTLPTYAWDSGVMLDILDYYIGLLIRTQGKEMALIYVCGTIVTIFFLKNVFRYLAMAVMAPVRNGTVRDIRRNVFDKILELPIGYFSNERKGDVLSRMTSDVQEIQWSIMNALEVIVREPLMILASLFVMVGISPKLTFFVFILILFTGLIIGNIGKALKRQSKDAQSRIGSIMSIIEETLGGLKIVKAFGAENYERKKFAKENEGFKNVMNRILWRKDLSSPLSEFLGIGVLVILLWFGARLVFAGDMAGDRFIFFLLTFYNIITPAKAFSTAFYNIQRGIGAAERIDQVLLAENNIQNQPNALPIRSFEKEIHYKNVSFAYLEGEPVLQNIDLQIAKGKIVALVGASGAGKSTLADLLPRFYDITSGELEIDGVSVKDYKLEDLRNLMGIVTQEAILFNDTIFNNIAFGLDVTEEDVIKAAKVANAHEFILETERGYQTNIGDRGSKLSGGQRQRITIARAVLKNPPILILDEATSALDSKAEKLVQDALQKLMTNRTAIVIAHRLSTIQHADEILVMQDGRIIERGNHKELAAKQGAYRKLVELQAF